MLHFLGLPGALLASGVLASASLAARVVMWLPSAPLRAWLPWLQALTVGLLLGDASLHMLPEALRYGSLSAQQVGLCLALGMLFLLLVECVMRSVPARAGATAFARMDVVADFLHHLVDGIVIGATFAVDTRLGVVVTLAVLGHELPREASNAGVLIAGGYTPRRAFALSVATTAAIPLGAAGVIVLGQTPAFLATNLVLAAGAAIYLACGDLLPGLWQTLGQRGRFIPILGAAAGLAFMWLAALGEQRA
jgi:zinc transporter ZupT